MKKDTTNRGFALYEFTDSKNTPCSIQKSSSAMEDKIWLGANEIGLKRFEANIGWSDVELVNTISNHYVANNRMELTREQVAEMLPILQKFVDTGDL